MFLQFIIAILVFFIIPLFLDVIIFNFKNDYDSLFSFLTLTFIKNVFVIMFILSFVNNITDKNMNKFVNCEKHGITYSQCREIEAEGFDEYCIYEESKLCDLILEEYDND